MKQIIKDLKHNLIVSCQATGESPFNSPEGVGMFAISAVQGGAAGIRSEGFEKTKHIKNIVDVPVIGLIKSKFKDGYVKITGNYMDIEALMKTGCDIIAVDGTFREREGVRGFEYIQRIKERYKCTVMADIATLDEGIACSEVGADIISTTLSGYTPETKSDSKEPDYELVKNLVDEIDTPVFAEGRVNTPEAAKKMIEMGAWSVVVGTAITRPHIVTSWFGEAIRESSQRQVS